MEGKSTQELTEKSKVFQIPIEDFEDDMNTESSKEKKKEILELFTTYNKLCSKEEFYEVESNLHEACGEGDLEMIKIFLSKTIEDSTNTLKFKIDETNQTASLLEVLSEVEELIVPRTVEHESTEYLITSIIDTCFGIKNIKFCEDSAVKTICKCDTSTIEEIYFPASLKELKDGWCCGTEDLKKIIISPLNSQFEFKEDKYLVCKSEPNKDEFDKLLFVRRDIKEFSVPSNIKIISSYAFADCQKLLKIEIPKNSNLQIIESNAFINSKIEEIYFPASLKELKEGWCCGTEKLKKITISPLNGQFEFKEEKYLVCKSEPNKDEFDKLLFVRRDIEEFSVPPNIKIISSYAFADCQKLLKIEIPKNSNLQTIGSSVIDNTKIESIFIPSKVSKICKFAFSCCKNLLKVEIPPDSNLQTIESYAFSSSNIESIFIPSKVSIIIDYSFSYCENLLKVEIPKNSNLQIIESNAFINSKIEEINFPASLKELKEGWCRGTEKLKKITISPLNGQFEFKEEKYLVCKSEPNKLLFVRRDIEEFSIPSNIKIISSYAFANSNIKSIFIPSSVSKICSYSFSFCENLKKVKIPPDSNLQTIESNAFSSSNIESILIPSNVSKIGENAFSCCENLLKVEIPPDSNLKTIESNIFYNTKIESIFIPSNVSDICEFAFSKCENLRKVEISPNSNLKTIRSNVFSDTKIESIFIPASVSTICSYSFSICDNLKKVEIPPDSNLKTIRSNAFSNTKIESIFIPASVSTICSYSFSFCDNLKKVEIPPDSNLQTIESDAFSSSKIESIFIPSKVSIIGEDAFSYCDNLQIIEISEESELEEFPFSAFEKCQQAIIMIPASLRTETLIEYEWITPHVFRCEFILGDTLLKYTLVK